MKLDKKLVDDLIMSTIKYYGFNDLEKHGLNEAMREMHLAGEEIRKTHHSYQAWRATNLIEDLAKFARGSDTITYGDIYNALEIFGIIVEEKENE